MEDDQGTEDLFGEDWRSKVQAKGGRQYEDPLAESLERSRERGRGREATAPETIPPLGWRDILWRVLEGILADRILYTSGGVAFFTLLAFFPAVATIVSLYGLVTDVSTIREHLTPLESILPDGAIKLIGDQMAHIAGQRGTLSSVFFIVALWSANSGVAALFRRLQRHLQGEREAESPASLWDDVPVHVWMDRIHARGHRRRDRGAPRAHVHGHVHTGRASSLDSALAGSYDRCHSRVGRTLSLWTKPPIGKVALGDMGQHGGGRVVDSYIHAVLLVCGQLRKLQSPLRLAWSRNRLHGLDLAFCRCHPDRSRAQRRDGAPNCAGHDGRS